MRKVGLVAMVAMVLAVILSLTAVPAFATPVCDWDKSTLEWSCIHSDGATLTAQVCNNGDAMQGSVAYELWWAVSGDPKVGTKIADGTIGPLGAGECTTVTFTFDAGHGPTDQYGFKAYQRCGHPGTGVLWITSDQDSGNPCPPVPNLSTIGLFSIGLLALGGFVWTVRRRHAEVV